MDAGHQSRAQAGQQRTGMWHDEYSVSCATETASEISRRTRDPTACSCNPPPNNKKHTQHMLLLQHPAPPASSRSHGPSAWWLGNGPSLVWPGSTQMSASGPS